MCTERISEIVAEAVNQEAFETLADDLADELEELSAEDKQKALKDAYIICVMASQPGCLPDSWVAFPQDTEPENIREEIIDQAADEEADMDAIRKEVEALDLAGSSMPAPDGRVIEVFRKSCADVLADNNIRL